MAKTSAHLSPDGLLAAFLELEITGKPFEVYWRRRLAPDARPISAKAAARIGIGLAEVARHEKLIEELLAAQMRRRDSPLRLAAEHIGDRLGPLAPRRELDAILRGLDPLRRVLGQEAPRRRALLLFLAGGYRVDEDWVTGSALDRPSRRGLLEELTNQGPVGLGELRLVLDRLGVRSELQLPWIEAQRGYRLVEGRLFRIELESDRAALALAGRGRPVTPGELYELTPHRSRAALNGMLERDRRFQRVGWKTYGLAEWGTEPFVDVRRAICQEIERHDGEMDLEALVDTLGARFGVPAPAIRGEAAGRRGIELDRHGRVSWRGGEEVLSPPIQPLAFTRRCHRLRNGWGFRVDLGASHLRDAAVSVPRAFARELERRPGGHGSVVCRPGLIEMPWRGHDRRGLPRLGGLRAAADASGAEPGDLLFLVIRPLGGVELTVIERERREAAAGWERLAIECGREPVDELLTVAEALNLAPDLPDLGAVIERRLAERGERDLLALVSS